MKMKRLCLIAGLGIVLSCLPAKAQSGFFFGVDAASANFWTGTGIQIIKNLASSLLDFNGDGLTPVMGGRYTYTFMTLSSEGEKVQYNPDDKYGLKSIFGFRSKDLFGYLLGNVKFGWMGPYSPIGAYVHLGYDYRNFSMMLPNQTEAQDFRIGTLKPGIGIRISPSNFYDSDADSKFILEIGTDYNKRVSYKGPYDNDKTQLNNGLSYVAALGLAWEDSSVLLGVEWANHDLFNKDYTPDSGTFFPYNNLTSHLTSVFLSYNYGF